MELKDILPKGYEVDQDIPVTQHDHMILLVPIKRKEVVITTEDGVDLYHGDEFWVARKYGGKDFVLDEHDTPENTGCKYIFIATDMHLEQCGTIKYFSTREAAEKFIEEKNRKPVMNVEGKDLYKGDKYWIYNKLSGQVFESLVFSERMRKKSVYIRFLNKGNLLRYLKAKPDELLKAIRYRNSEPGVNQSGLNSFIQEIEEA